METDFSSNLAPSTQHITCAANDSNNTQDELRIDIWSARLEVLHPIRMQYLSEDEIRRSERFMFDRHRTCFLLSRQFLHNVIREYRPSHRPQSIRIPRSGKPRLHRSAVHFNLSHSPLAVFVAVGRRPIGIDAEPIARSREVAEIARRILADSEWEHSTPETVTPEKVLSRWVAKEAYLKGLGCGLRVDPRRVLLDWSEAKPITATIDGREGSIRTISIGALDDHLIAVSARETHFLNQRTLGKTEPPRLALV